MERYVKLKENKEVEVYYQKNKYSDEEIWAMWDSFESFNRYAKREGWKKVNKKGVSGAWYDSKSNTTYFIF